MYKLHRKTRVGQAPAVQFASDQVSLSLKKYSSVRAYHDDELKIVTRAEIELAGSIQVAWLEDIDPAVTARIHTHTTLILCACALWHYIYFIKRYSVHVQKAHMHA